MAWVAVQENNTEWIYAVEPYRDFCDGTWCIGEDCLPEISLPKGSIFKLIGKELTWEHISNLLSDI